MAKLSIQVSSTESVDFTLDKKSTLIGRGSACDLVIDNSYISSQHAIIHHSDDNDVYIIEDRDSTHGVRVNGNKVIAEKLADGDIITLGQLEISFKITQESSPLEATTRSPLPTLKPHQSPQAKRPTLATPSAKATTSPADAADAKLQSEPIPAPTSGPAPAAKEAPTQPLLKRADASQAPKLMARSAAPKPNVADAPSGNTAAPQQSSETASQTRSPAPTASSALKPKPVAGLKPTPKPATVETDNDSSGPVPAAKPTSKPTPKRVVVSVPKANPPSEPEALEQPTSTPEPVKKSTRRTATIKPPLPIAKSEVGPRTSKISAVPEGLGTPAHLESQISELEEKLANLQERETSSRRKYDDALEDMRTDIADLSKQRTRLREEVDDLNDRHRTASARIDDEDDAFLPVVYEVVKRVDLIDAVVSSVKASDSPDADLLTQLETLQQSFDDLFERHNIIQESIEPGTALNMGLRRRIKIVEAEGGDSPKEADQAPGQAKVVKTVRPGIVYSPPGGSEALLRKVEVIVAQS